VKITTRESKHYGTQKIDLSYLPQKNSNMAIEPNKSVKYIRGESQGAKNKSNRQFSSVQPNRPDVRNISVPPNRNRSTFREVEEE
jgi:hypothetical protein